MWSITITDTLQLLLIIVGLGLLGYEILAVLGQGAIGAAWPRLIAGTPPSFWRLADDESYSSDVLSAVSILTIASLGNVPVQD